MVLISTGYDGDSNGIKRTFCQKDKSALDLVDTNYVLKRTQNSKILVDFFENTSEFPLREEMKRLAKKTKMTYYQVDDWFNSRRDNKRKKMQKLSGQLETPGSLHTKAGIYKQIPDGRPYNPQILIDFFNKREFPLREDKEMLAKKTGMTFKQVQTWFKNRRGRMKKEVQNLSGELEIRDSTIDEKERIREERRTAKEKLESLRNILESPYYF